MTQAITSQPSQAAARHAWTWVAAVGLLAIHATIAVDTLRGKSVTVDEVGHLPAGISYWQKGTFELYHHNPPLVKLLAALPALAAGPTVDYSKGWDDRPPGMPLNQWVFGWQFMYDNAARYHDIYIWARLPVFALSLLAGVVIFLWASQLFGRAAGLVGLALWTFCPNAIAHSGMVTTDMGATSLGFVATYFFWRYLCRPTWRRAGVAGVMLGLAELAKFSSLLLYVIWPAVWLAWLVANFRGRAYGFQFSPPGRSEQVKGATAAKTENRSPDAIALVTVPAARSFIQFLTILATSVFIINLGYCFEGTGTPLKQFSFLSQSLTRPRLAGAAVPVVPADHPWRDVLLSRQNRFAGTWLAHLPVPLPRHYVEGFDEQKLESEGFAGSGYPVYLCGELRRTGWWWYYFFALAIKVPLGTWLLSLLAVGGLTWRKLPHGSLVDELTLLSPVVVGLVVMSFVANINLGLRYVLPIFPFWFVLVSRVGCGTLTRSVSEGDLWSSPRLRFGFVSAFALAALAWNAVACRRIHPDHLAYFNELVGGPELGSRYLIDSNIDWGQDLLALEEWLRAHRPGERVGLAYFGNVDPSVLAASGRPLNFTLAPPRRLDDLRLLGTKPTGPIAQTRNKWVIEHADELRQWLAIRHERGRPARTNDHPELRRLVIDSLGLKHGPQPGLFAVSVNLCRGLPFRVRDHEGSIWDAAQDAYQYFGNFQPIGRAGQSILIYDISPEEAWRVHERLNPPEDD